MNPEALVTVVSQTIDDALTLVGPLATHIGAALLALAALGLLPDVAQVPAHIEPPVQPDVVRHTVYRKGAEWQQKLYRP